MCARLRGWDCILKPREESSFSIGVGLRRGIHAQSLVLEKLSQMFQPGPSGWSYPGPLSARGGRIEQEAETSQEAIITVQGRGENGRKAEPSSWHALLSVHQQVTDKRSALQSYEGG